MKGVRKVPVRYRLHSELHFWKLYVAGIPQDGKGNGVADRKIWKKDEETFFFCSVFQLIYLCR